MSPPAPGRLAPGSRGNPMQEPNDPHPDVVLACGCRWRWCGACGAWTAVHPAPGCPNGDLRCLLGQPVQVKRWGRGVIDSVRIEDGPHLRVRLEGGGHVVVPLEAVRPDPKRAGIGYR